MEFSPTNLVGLPEGPGVYRFYSKEQVLLYVGKAKSLVARIKSYFREQNLPARTKLMVQQIAKIEITLTDSEVSALILEHNFIRSQNPKYNVVFKDGGGYPFLHLSDHGFSRLTFQHDAKPTGLNFGPYASSATAKTNFELVQKLFKIRTCPDHNFSQMKRPCLLYQLDKCSAPCCQLISRNDYLQSVLAAQKVLSGRFNEVKKQLTKQMKQLASQEKFEQAAVLKATLASLQELQNGQKVNYYDENLNLDLWFLAQNDNSSMSLYVMFLRKGVLLGDKTFKLPQSGLNFEDSWQSYLTSYYLDSKIREEHTRIFLKETLTSEFKLNFESCTGKILLQELPKALSGLEIIGLKNLEALQDRNLVYLKGFEELKQLLGLSECNRLEAVDISHHAFADQLGSLVAFNKSGAVKADYRKFNLSHLDSKSDLEAINYLLEQRFAKNFNPPSVLLIDGGGVHLKHAKATLAKKNITDCKVIAISKGEKRKACFDKIWVTEKQFYQINELTQAVSFLLQKARDEAHRFAITGHRKKQASKLIKSQALEIEGVGREKLKLLLQNFHSLEKLRAASLEELTSIKGVGYKTALTILKFFKNA